MGYTEADAQADAHASDLAEQEAIAQDARLQELEADQKREFEERFARIFPGLHPNERAAFSRFLFAQSVKFSEQKLSRSDARFMILKAVAYCPDFKVDLHRDEMDVYELIELIVPEKDEPGWGRVGRPKTLRHRIYRMVEDGLLEVTSEGRMTTSIALGQFGSFYLHQSGHFPGPDLLGFWRWLNDAPPSFPAPVWDNPRYLEYVETGVVRRDQEFTLSTPGASKWQSLRHLHNDGWMPRTTGRLEEYDLKLKAVTNAIEMIHEGTVVECFKILTTFDRHALIDDVLVQSDIGNHVLRGETIDRIDRGSYGSRLTRLTGYYHAAHPDEDAHQVVCDLIVRSAWDPEDYVEIDEDYYEPDEDIARGR